MKVPLLADIPNPTPETSFNERAKVAKLFEKTGGAVLKRTFSLLPGDSEYVDAMALKLGQERGKPVNASSALRAIIEQHRARP